MANEDQIGELNKLARVYSRLGSIDAPLPNGAQRLSSNPAHVAAAKHAIIKRMKQIVYAEK